MHLDLTNRRWWWTSLVAGLLCVALGCALIWKIEANRRAADQTLHDLRQLSRLAGEVHRLLGWNGIAEAQWRTRRDAVSAAAQALKESLPGDGDALELAVRAEHLATTLDRRRKDTDRDGEFPFALLESWFARHDAVHLRLSEAHQKPLLAIKQATGWGLIILLGGAVLLLLRHRMVGQHLRRRQEADEALRSSEIKYRELFANIHEAIYQSTPDGKLVAANPALLRLLGIESESEKELKKLVFGQDLFVDPAERSRVLEKLKREGSLRNEKLRLRRRDGGEVIVLENARTVRNESGAVLYYEGTLTDITERTRAEQAAAEHTRMLEEARSKLEQQAQQLLELSFELAEARDRAVEGSRRKSEFFANLTQEIRSPMQAVADMAHLLLESHLAPHQRESAVTLLHSAGEMLRVLDDILEYSRIETGQVELAQEAFSLRTVVEGVIDATAEAAEDKGLEMTFLTAPDVPDALVGDAGRLAQILRHVVDNAIKFTAWGEVTVTVARARESREEVLLRFQVEDSGKGITPDNYVRLFEPFCHIVDGDKGAGLGLPIAKQLVERMGGQIGVESEPGQGSLVWFQVKLAKQPGAAARPAADSARLRGIRLLVVDEVASSRGMLSTVAAAWGMKVVTAEEPAQALELLQLAAHQGQPFDCVLLDHDLPGLGGLGLAEAVLDDPATSGIPVILLVPHSQRSWQDEPLLDGIKAVIAKPVRENQLLRVLLECLEWSRSEIGQLSSGIRSLEPVPPAGPDPEEGRTPCILVVEDNLVNQRVTVRLVQKMGYRAEVATNGEDALEALSKEKFKVILMDCQMPVMDGFQTTAAIRAMPGEVSATPIIAMTANAMKGDREKCLDAGMDDYLSKPVSYEDLRGTLNRWLQRPLSSELPSAS